MKKLSLPEFRDYCNNIIFNTIIFSTSNQTWDRVDSTIAASLSFNSMIFTFNPNIIHLRNNQENIRFKKVKFVKLHDRKCLLGKVFTVVCGDTVAKTNDMEYTLILQ